MKQNTPANGEGFEAEQKVPVAIRASALTPVLPVNRAERKSISL